MGSEGASKLPMGHDRSGMPALIPVWLLSDAYSVTCMGLREGILACEQENRHSQYDYDRWFDFFDS
jgi:hypothetical protein